MSTQLWRLRVRLANAVNLLDADRIQIQVRDRVIADDAARLHFLCDCNLLYQPLPEKSFQMAPYVAELLEDTAGDLGLGLHREEVLQAV